MNNHIIFQVFNYLSGQMSHDSGASDIKALTGAKIVSQMSQDLNISKDQAKTFSEHYVHQVNVLDSLLALVEDSISNVDSPIPELSQGVLIDLAEKESLDIDVIEQLYAQARSVIEAKYNPEFFYSHLIA